MDPVDIRQEELEIAIEVYQDCVNQREGHVCNGYECWLNLVEAHYALKAAMRLHGEA